VVGRGLQLLQQARKLVARGWCQGSDARDSNGAGVEPWDPQAASWSLLGALVAAVELEAAASGEIPLSELAAALNPLADLVDTDSLAAWNDKPDRSQAEVVAVLDRAVMGYATDWKNIELSSN
jgi:hypothetical protein